MTPVLPWAASGPEPLPSCTPGLGWNPMDVVSTEVRAGSQGMPPTGSSVVLPLLGVQPDLLFWPPAPPHFHWPFRDCPLPSKAANVCLWRDSWWEAQRTLRSISRSMLQKPDLIQKGAGACLVLKPQNSESLCPYWSVSLATSACGERAGGWASEGACRIQDCFPDPREPRDRLVFLSKTLVRIETHSQDFPTSPWFGRW